MIHGSGLASTVILAVCARSETKGVHSDVGLSSSRSPRCPSGQIEWRQLPRSVALYGTHIARYDSERLLTWNAS